MTAPVAAWRSVIAAGRVGHRVDGGPVDRRVQQLAVRAHAEAGDPGPGGHTSQHRTRCGIDLDQVASRPEPGVGRAGDGGPVGGHRVEVGAEPERQRADPLQVGPSAGRPVCSPNGRLSLQPNRTFDEPDSVGRQGPCRRWPPTPPALPVDLSLSAGNDNSPGARTPTRAAFGVSYGNSGREMGCSAQRDLRRHDCRRPERIRSEVLDLVGEALDAGAESRQFVNVSRRRLAEW